MLHGVRFIQSQLHARVAEFSLKDWLATLKEQEFSDATIASHAKKAHREAKIHCFLSGLAVAVEGELPSSGVVLVSAADVPFALRVLTSLTPLWLDAKSDTALHNSPSGTHAELLRKNAASALAEGVTVAWPVRTVARSYSEDLVRLANRLGLPVVGATVEENTQPKPADPLDVLLARRDVLVTVGTPLAALEAHGFIAAECARLTTNGRSRVKATSRDWKPADVALS